MLALGIVSLAACNTDELPPPGQYASVSGVITDGVSHKPIAGAVVTIDSVLTATTDASGAFSFEKVPAGTLDYTVTAHGYAQLSATAIAEPAKTFTLTAALTRSPSAP